MSQERAKDKNMETTLLMGEISTYKPLRVDFSNKFMMGEDKYPTSITGTFKTMPYCNITDMGVRIYHTQNPDGHTSFLQHDYDEKEEGGNP